MIKQKINSLSEEIARASIMLFIISILTHILFNTPFYIIPYTGWIIIFSIIINVWTD